MLFHSCAHMLPSSCAGIGAWSGTLSLPYFSCSSRADVAVELVVERLDVAPEALDVGLELGRRHVVAGAPEGADVVEPDLLRAPRSRARRTARTSPSSAPRSRASRATPRRAPRSRGSCARTRERSSRCRHGAGLLACAWAFSAYLKSGDPGARAVLALAVRARHPRLDPGELGSPARVARRGDRLGERQEVELAREVGRELREDRREALGPRDRVADVRRRGLLAGRGERLGVVGDEVLVHPVGAVARDPEPAQVRFDVVHEGAGRLERGRRGGGRRSRRRRSQWQCGRRRRWRPDRRGRRSWRAGAARRQRERERGVGGVGQAQPGAVAARGRRGADAMAHGGARVRRRALAVDLRRWRIRLARGTCSLP